MLEKKTLFCIKTRTILLSKIPLFLPIQVHFSKNTPICAKTRTSFKGQYFTNFIIHHLHMTSFHTLQLNFLLSDWLFSKYAECIENVHCTPRTACRLRPDCPRCFWCVISHANVTSTDPFFSLGKVVNILHV